jgi:predicted membrane-bound spermidine synthase
MGARSKAASLSMSELAQQTAAGGRVMHAYAAAALLFVSGAAALIYQVIWIKQLSLVVGVEVYAITTAISAFFAGLALGGLVFGRWADRTGRPVRLYAALEVGIAVAAITTTLLLARAAPPFASLEAVSNLLAWTMVFVLVGVPPLLMGGTLPALVRTTTRGRQDMGRIGGRLYAANTAGAIVGALLPVFLLIPALGVQGTAIAAAILNLVAAAGAVLLDRASNARTPAIPSNISARLSPQARLALALYAAAGGIALGYEIVWSQAIVQFMSTRSFAFSVVLATYLAGLAIGSALFARWVERIRAPGAAFGLLIAAAGWVALVEIAVLGHWLVVVQTAFEAAIYHSTGSDLAGMCARFAVAAIFVVLLPTLLLGAAFPAALKLTVGETSVGRDVGAVVALNTFGGIAGTMLTGFVLIPWLGLVRSLAVLAIMAASIGVAAMICFPGTTRSRWGILAIGATGIAVAIATPADQLARLLPAARTGNIVFYEESPAGTVAVIETSRAGNRFHRLYIQGVSNSGDAMPSLRYMRLQALLPLIIHNGDPKSALVIGYGTGITAGALSQFPGLERRVVSELLPAVLLAGSNFEGTFGADRDPGLEKRLHDGRRELQRNDQSYDLITLEPPPPSAADVVNLYSSDFYRLAASRLNDKGIVAQWLPIPTQNDEDTRSLVRSFIDVFPHVSLWSTELHETMLVGSLQPIELNVLRIGKRFNQPQTSAALRAVGINSPAALIATWITDRGGLERFAAGAPAVTDDRPRIEYATWVRPDEFVRAFAHIQQIRSDPPLVGADEQFGSALALERKDLDTFYRAGLSVYARDRRSYAREMTALAESAKRNSYYAWFTGRREQ